MEEVGEGVRLDDTVQSWENREDRKEEDAAFQTVVPFSEEERELLNKPLLPLEPPSIRTESAKAEVVAK